MNRRGFLQSLLGLGASAALPAPALEFLAKHEHVSDAKFLLAAHNSDALINLMEARMRDATLAMCKMIDAMIYNDTTFAQSTLSLIESK
jgi:hypothetical protein